MHWSSAALHFLILFTITLEAKTDRNDEEKLSDRANPIGLFGNDRRMKESDYCVVKCLPVAAFPESVKDFIRDVYKDVFRLENSTNIGRIFNKTMLELYCQFDQFVKDNSMKGDVCSAVVIKREILLYGEKLASLHQGKALENEVCNINWHIIQRRQCILQCGNDSFYRREFLKIFEPTSYVCNESNFMDNLECYRKVYDQDLDKCESADKCLPHKLAVIYLIDGNFGFFPYYSEPKAMLIAFSKLCRYLICGNECRANRIITHCGQEANEILLGFYSRLVASMKIVLVELYHMFTGVELTIPDICNEI